ncbi:hypothetical protein D3C85_1328400 [compost metagenome]
MPISDCSTTARYFSIASWRWRSSSSRWLMSTEMLPTPAGRPSLSNNGNTLDSIR